MTQIGREEPIDLHMSVNRRAFRPRNVEVPGQPIRDHVRLGEKRLVTQTCAPEVPRPRFRVQHVPQPDEMPAGNADSIALLQGRGHVEGIADG